MQRPINVIILIQWWSDADGVGRGGGWDSLINAVLGSEDEKILQKFGLIIIK